MLVMGKKGRTLAGASNGIATAPVSTKAGLVLLRPYASRSAMYGAG